MTTKKHIILTAALAVGLGVALARAVNIGEPAPGFTLKDPNGKAHSLSDYRGKYVVLEWVNHGCPYVKKHYASGNMQALQREMASRDVIWLTICSSAPGKQGHYAAADWPKQISRHNMASAAVLLDESGDVGRSYGAKTTPHMYVISPDGILVYQGAIDDKPSTDEADVKTAKNFVRSAIESSLAGKPVEPSRTKPYGCGVKY